jgi:glycosyltransferase involved in cell wall biosynthesis
MTRDRWAGSFRVGVDASNLKSGGAVTHLVNLLSAAHPGRFGVRGVTVWGGADILAKLPRRPWLSPVHVHLLDKSMPIRTLWQARILDRTASKACDILWVPGGSYAGSFAPVVTMCRNMLPFDSVERRRYGWSYQRLRNELLRWSQSRTFRRSEGVIFLSRYARDSVVVGAGVMPRAEALIPHGVDAALLALVRSDEAEPRRGFRLLYVSTVDVYKHQEVVVEAVGTLRKEGFPVTLDLIGGAYQPSLRRLNHVIDELGLGEEVTYHGPLPQERLAEFYRSSDVFVFASSCENLPNILLEAMASGLPIACAERGPMPDLLGAAGVYFSPESVLSVADAIRSLLVDPALRLDVGARARARAVPYSWALCSDRTFEFIRQVLDSYRETLPLNAEGFGA